MDIDDFVLTMNRMKDMLRKRDLRVFRDDLIRLVVSRQWREMCGPSGPEVNPGADLRPAVDIVDEWLGVR